MNMGLNLFRGLAIDISIIFLLVWVLSKISGNSFGNTALVSLAADLMCFFNTEYVNHIWHQTFDLNASFLDVTATWGLVGIWLG